MLGKTGKNITEHTAGVIHTITRIAGKIVGLALTALMLTGTVAYGGYCGHL